MTLVTTLIGVISDTRGLLRPQALQALQGVQLILHAGDIGAPEVLAGLRELAPVKAVRGNVPWARKSTAPAWREAAGVAGYPLDQCLSWHLMCYVQYFPCCSADLK